MLCLYLVGTIRKNRYEKIKTGRLAAASILCAGLDAVVLVLLYNGGEQVSLFPLGITIAELFLGAWCAYGKQGLVQNGLLLFVVTALLAGFFQLVPEQNVGLFCLVGTLLLPVCAAGAEAIFRAKQTQRLIYEARLCQNEEEKCLSAFLDTGNRLRLFGSSLPVVLVDETYLAEWIKEAEAVSPQKLVFLPYKGVGGKGILHGVRLRCVLALENGQTLSGEVAAVATEHRLFHGCRYQMILQPEVLSMVCVKDTQEGERNVV